MTAYAAFLRGINLGPTRKVAMPRLRELCAELGWTDVATYINSGNVVFTSSKKPPSLARELAAAVETETGHQIDVAVRSRADLHRILAANPFPEGAGNRVSVSFLMQKLPAAAERAVADLATDNEPYVTGDHEVWVDYRDGQAKSKLAARFADAVSVSATTRNVNTVQKVLALLDALG